MQLFKNEKLNKYLNEERINVFKEEVFQAFLEENFQYVRALLSKSKDFEKNELRNQVLAYEKVICYLDKEQNKDTQFANNVFFLKEDKNAHLRKYIDEATVYLKEHITERINRYNAIIEVSNDFLSVLDKKSNEESLLETFETGLFESVNSLNDQSQRSSFLSALFRMILRVLKSEDKKIELILSLLGEQAIYSKQIKCIHTIDTKPILVKNVSQMLKLLDESENNYYRGHSSSEFNMIPSVYRDGLFYFEDDLIKEMILRLPDDFPKDATHYEKLMKMQHYGIPTKLLDVTSNPLVALFMAADGFEHMDGEVLMIKNDSFEECYPSSDKVKILTSIPFLPFSTKIILAYLLDLEEVTNEMFNQLAKPLLHEIKHEMPAFEARMEQNDLKNHLFILGPKSNKRINAQSGHFIISPLTLKFFASTPVDYVMKNDNKLRVIIPAKDKEKILTELKKLNISRSTMYPEIEHVAKEIKHQYL